ncbi:MAG: hypothetical protein F4Y44_06460 [Chloroflexi bacterium]|nr:hypothetical protein [Chloroflexota bacterium]
MMKTSSTLRVVDVLERYGSCLELVPMDPNFKNISVGLYVKNGICTVWTFSGKQGVEARIEQIREQLVALGGMEAVPGTYNQARFACGGLHERPMKFLMTQAVGKAPDYAPPQGEMTIQDSRSPLTIKVTGSQRDDAYVYSVSVEGDAPRPAVRLRMVVAGFLRYGEMQKVGDTEVAFPCGQRHDELMRLLLPYSRNISSVEGMMAAEALRGQMTTGTLGFSQT